MRVTGSAPAGAAARPGRSVFLALAAAGAFAGLSLGVILGRPVVGAGAAGGVAMSAAIVSGLVTWRFSLYGLLLYLPVSGIPILATYPHAGPATLLKDAIFVGPAYLGFMLELLRGRIRLSLSPLPVTLVTMLAVLVSLQALNPALPNMLVGAIGIKVWLWYIPLAFLAYHLVADRRDLRRLLKVMSVSAALPIALGLVEAALFRAGQADFVYRFYGASAASATQLFTEFQLPSGGMLRRVPSTFSSWTQYYAFVFSMVSVTYAWWRAVPGGGRAAAGRGALWLLAVASAFLSGARVAFLAVPGLIVLTLALEHVGAYGVRRRQLLVRLGAPAAALAVAVLALGVSAGGLLGEVFHKARHEFGFTFLHRFHQAADVTWLGLGSGIDTIASRYAAPPEQLFAAFGGVWYESWFVKVVLELGVPGLLLVLAIFGTMLFRGAKSYLALRDSRLRAVAAALLVFLFVNVLLALSKPYIDNDPVNVYFWLFAGVLAKLVVIDNGPATSRAAA